MAQTVLAGNLFDAKSQNLIPNGGFELWSSGVSFNGVTINGTTLADGWINNSSGNTINVNRESVQIDPSNGKYSMKVEVVTPSGSNAKVYSTHNRTDLVGRTVTVTSKVKTTIANGIRIELSDGVGGSYSAYHTGSGDWETLTTSFLFTSGMTVLHVAIGFELTTVTTGIWYIDSVMATASTKGSDYVTEDLELDKVKSGELLNLQIASYGKNKIINGNGLVDQRYASNPRTVNTSTWNNGPDRWHAWGMPAAGVFTIERAGGSGLSQHNGHIKITVTTADASVTAGDSYWFGQNIEGWRVKELDFGSSNYRVFTLSFFVRSSVAGTFAGGFVNDGTTRSYVFTYTVNTPNTWEYKTITTYADNTGTWNQGNLAGLRVLWDVGSGSSYEGTVNSWQAGFKYSSAGSTKLISTINATLSVTGVQLEVGPRATPYDHRGFGEELILCQRYFETSYDYGTLPGTASQLNGRIWGTRQNGGFVATHHFKVSKRIAPNLLTIWSPQSGTNARVWNFANNADEVASADDIGTEGFHVSATTTTTGHAIGYHFSASAEF